MREINLFLILTACLAMVLANEHHEHSLKHVQKRHDIPLEFIMNSHEHSDIRRSVRVEKENIERLSSDKFVVRRDDPSSSEVTGDSDTVPDKFDQPSYDFMLPEGKSENSTILAVVDFITRKHNSKPLFIVNFDENAWFDIGDVVKTTADNADVYKATVILKANAEVTMGKTEGGIYKFTVEAQQGEMVLATTWISVEVLSLAPTTKRVRVTVPMEPKTEATTSSDDVTTEKASESLEVATSTSSDELKVTETTSEGLESATDDLTTLEAATSTTSSDSTTSKSLTSSAVDSEASTTPESVSDDALILGGFPTSSESPTTTSESAESSTSEEDDEEEEEVEVLDGSGDLEGSATPSTLFTQSFPEFQNTSTTSEASGDTDTDDELLTSSTDSQPESESESPIDGPVTILPLQTSPDGRIEPIEAILEVSGLQNDQIQVPIGSRKGDMIRNCHVALIGRLDGDKQVLLSVEPEGILEIRPNVVRANEQAGVFIFADQLDFEKKKVEMIAKYEGVEVRREVDVVKMNVEESGDSETFQGSDMVQLREISFEIPDTFESGKTIGSVEEPMRILNSDPQIFSLINGMDVILSCQEESCLQNIERPQKLFTLILMPLSGALAPLQVNIRILEPRVPMIRTSDDVIRISDNKIITKFAVITERTDKVIRLDGSAAKFLVAKKDQEGLYQLIVSNSAPSGKYDLLISVPSAPPGDEIQVTVPVHVSNSLGHAHFRQAKYSVDFDALEDVKMDRPLAHVELEGVPIDEAKIMILDGNPGWVTVEEYGGKVKVAKFDGPIYTGKSAIRIGAVDKKTWTILTETLLELNVINGVQKPENDEKTDSEASRSRVIEATFNRENEQRFEVELEENGLKLDPRSIFGIDEKGKRVNIEPTSISINSKTVKLQQESLKTLRTLSFMLKSQDQKIKYHILIRLISSPEYLITQRKIASRPVYPEPWTREDTVIQVEMNEELEEGQVLGVFPAMVPVPVTTSSTSSESLPTPSKLSGDMADAFSFDPTTGQLKIRQRIDFESLSEGQKTFDLKLTSGDVGFESEATLRVKVIDIDDNSPVISAGDVEMISIPENLPCGSKIAELDVTDPDGSESFTVELDGPGSQNYVANITDTGKLSIFVSDSAKIDREQESAQLLLVKVSDISGNSDRLLLPVRILDVNDNAPEFTQKLYEVEVVEDWPRGMLISKLSARDPDLNQAVSYSTPSEVISVNETTGAVTVAGDLWGMARDVPYRIEVVAEDSGTGESKMTSTAILSLKVKAKEDVMVESKVEIVQPAEVTVKENTPLDTKILTIKAETRGLPTKTHGPLIYTLKDLISDKDIDFAIDKTSGDIFAVKPIDFETRKEYTLQITATSSDDENLTASTILKIHVENLDDNEPEFLEGLSQVFLINKNTTKPVAIGRLSAFDADSKPIFYQILPTCGSEMATNFTIDPEFGEIVYHPKRVTVDDEEVQLCFIATSQKDQDVSEVFFDGAARNMRKVTVVFGEDHDGENEKQHYYLNYIANNQSISKIGDYLDRIEIPVLGSEMGADNSEYTLKNLQFVPANYELGRDVISPEGSVELNSKTGELVANGRILDTPQGVYTAEIQRKSGNSNGNVAVKQMHHIKNDRKLRYILAMSRNEFGANSEKLRRQILEAIGDQNDGGNGKRLEVYFDEPVMDRKNSTWTSVCFYLTRDNAILDDKQMSALLSSSNGHIAKLHHIFKVVNIDQCSRRPASSSSSSDSQSPPPSDIPINTLILIAVVGLLIIALIALLAYVCCLSRYQRYLRQKTERMRMNSPGSYYKSPNLIPPPPGYIHTPPLPPPPPPAAIAFY